MRAFLETTHAITFTDEDMEAPYPDYRKALYLEAQINEVYIRRALVDTGSSANIIPLDVLDAAKITRNKIVRAKTQISGFENATEITMGYVQLDLKVGPLRSFTKFHVLDAKFSYHVLLGRPWLNKHKLVVSTYHQCVKGHLGMKPIQISENHTPFNYMKTNHVDAQYYEQFTSI